MLLESEELLRGLKEVREAGRCVVSAFVGRAFKEALIPVIAALYAKHRKLTHKRITSDGALKFEDSVVSVLVLEAVDVVAVFKVQ